MNRNSSRPGNWQLLPVILSMFISSTATVVAEDLQDLDILRDGWPRAFFFRQPDITLSRPNRPGFDQWERIFCRLDGIMGKTLDEEIPDTQARNIPIFTRFKQLHPKQAVLLHFNGDARDPRWECGEFFAGHWLYFNGCRVTDDVPAQPGECALHVEDPRLFRVNMGRFGDKNEDLGLCALGADGKPDWSRSEQLELLAVDAEARTLRVRRGAFGTTPRAFAAGKAYVAAHITEGPWTRKSNLLWFYNYSTRCPRDAKGRTCGDVLSEDLARRFRPGGALATLDGLEFDEMDFVARSAGRRQADCDGDGRADGGIFDGINSFGIGIFEFCRQLREKLGPDRIIMADGQMPEPQRCCGLLNGIESEGFPQLLDPEIADWSGGLNRFEFWRRNAHAPALNYIAHKFIDRESLKPANFKAGGMKFAQVPLSTTRLVMAAGLFCDATFSYLIMPSSKPGIGIYDELQMGTANRLHWLGRPLAPPVRLALRTPDLFDGGGTRLSDEFLASLRAAAEKVERDEDSRALKVTAPTGGATKLVFTIPNVRLPEGDLLLHCRVKADPMRGYPPEIPRLAWVSWHNTGAAAAPHGDTPALTPARIMTWVGREWFDASFYFRNLGPGVVDLTFEMEGGEPMSLADLTAHAATDVMARDYEHGVVLANPGTRPFTFDVSTLFTGAKLRRLQGSPDQDPTTNNGSAVGASVTVGPRDALFLAKE